MSPFIIPLIYASSFFGERRLIYGLDTYVDVPALVPGTDYVPMSFFVGYFFIKTKSIWLHEAGI